MRSVKLASFQKDLSKMEGSQRSITNFSILGFSLVMLLLTMALYHQGEIGFDAMLVTIPYSRHDGLLWACGGLIQPFQQPESDAGQR